MSNISQAFQNGKAFIAYLMAGDPDLERSRDYILAMDRAGADLIEVGIPFSDPIAEGEVIQRANLRALAQGTTVDKVFAMLASLRGQVKAPLAFLTYVNPVFVYGYDRFFARCRECGVSGIIIPDVPFEEQGEVREAACAHGVDLITLISPTSEERVARIAKAAQGFVYLVSSLGVTGVRSEITTDIPALVRSVKAITEVPVAVGFGVSTPAQAGELAASADGVIVGSAIVRIIEEHGQEAEEPLVKYVGDVKNAVTKFSFK